MTREEKEEFNEIILYDDLIIETVKPKKKIARKVVLTMLISTLAISVGVLVKGILFITLGLSVWNPISFTISLIPIMAIIRLISKVWEKKNVS